MSTTVGQQLRQAREERSLSIEQAATATRIKPHYLRALEAGELDALPSPAQVRGFIRAYAGHLGLDAERLLAVLDNRDPDAAPAAEPERGAFPMPAAVSHAEINGNGAGESLSAANAIFTDLGEQLQHQRELLGLSLDDVERHTHLRGRYLRALEAGQIDELPSPVQGRGMLKNYAAFLGMNPDALMLRFAEGLQARLAARQAAEQPVKVAAAKRRRRGRLPRWLRRFVSGDILIGGVLTVLLGLFVLWVSIRVFAETTEVSTATATAPSIAEVLLATSSPTLPATPEGTPTLTLPASLLSPPTQPPATDPVTGALVTSDPAQQGLQVTINVRQRAWMRVVVDGVIEFEGRVIPGSAYPYTGGSTVEINTSSGSALQVLVNGRDQGALGAFGEVVNRMYSIEGAITATPSITPTPTETAPATPTLPAATQLPADTPPALP